MPAHAIIFGIDKYTNPEWELSGAVYDAIDFAKWATTEGGVATADLHLLLSPRDEAGTVAEILESRGAAPELRVAVAAETTIRKTLYAYQKQQAGKHADRLWFYYAGHGLAQGAEGLTTGPLIVPSDVKDLDYYLTQGPIGLELFRKAMLDQPPREQFFFVDACRDVIKPTGTKALWQGLIWYVEKIESVRVSAPGFALHDLDIVVFEETRFPIKLTPSENLELVGPRVGAINVRAADDRLARITVLDGGGNKRGSGFEKVEVENLAPGLYSVAVEVGADRVVRSVMVQTGVTKTIDLHAAVPAPPSEQVAKALVAARMPSERASNRPRT
jgi:hypothetical protein